MTLQETNRLTKGSVRALIAEFCGYRWWERTTRKQQRDDPDFMLTKDEGHSGWKISERPSRGETYVYLCPEYTESLDAMRLAEELLNDEQHRQYQNNLREVVRARVLDDKVERGYLSAPANWKAAAFVMTTCNYIDS